MRCQTLNTRECGLPLPGPESGRLRPRQTTIVGNQAVLRRLQAKLTIGEVNDPLEHEADAAAEQVMRMPEPPLGLAATTPRISRKCDTCEQEDAKQIRTKRRGSGTVEGEAPDIVHEILAAPGRPLDAHTRTFMEPRFGRDLGDIRVHTGADAAKSAHAVGANAYTVGHHLVFGDGQYTPGTHSGAKLLAHELTHALQQGLPRESYRHLRRQSDPKYTPQPAGPYNLPSPSAPQTCLHDRACAQPIPGSSWDFAHKSADAQRREADLQKADPARASAAGSRSAAINVTAFANKKDPTLLPGVLVFVNPLLEQSQAWAQATDCQGNAPQPSQPACLEVKKQLEDEALVYNTKTDPMIGTKTRAAWEATTMMTLTHEREHVKWASTPSASQGKTVNDQNVFNYSPNIFLYELGELNSQLSEYPIYHRAVMASTNVPDADKPAKAKEWVSKHIATGGENFRGMLTKLRCVSTCPVVNDGVKKVYNAQSVRWTDDQRKLFVAEVTDQKYNLDWPTG